MILVKGSVHYLTGCGQPYGSTGSLRNAWSLLPPGVQISWLSLWQPGVAAPLAGPSCLSKPSLVRRGGAHLSGDWRSIMEPLCMYIDGLLDLEQYVGRAERFTSASHETAFIEPETAFIGRNATSQPHHWQGNYPDFRPTTASQRN